MFGFLAERSCLGLSHVDDALCVHSISGEWLYVVGDTNAQAPLIHMGKYSAKVAGDAIAARAKETLTKEAIATA
jgi:pyruvate/2-oxoglutarate dehydrogenase complex dihydrolipoamide dehydrogenase (E3) component